MRVVLALWRASLLTAMQYRADFILATGMSIGLGLWTLAPVLLVYHHTQNIDGWSYPQALLVVAFHLAMRGLVYGLIEPNLRQLVAQVRDGTLDFVLLKPADAQLMVSISRIVPGRLVDLLSAALVMIWSLVQLGHTPTAMQITGAALCFLAGATVLYSLWLLAASTVFWWVRVDSLSHLLSSLLDAGQWPGVIYRGWVKVVLTFVLPIIVITTHPAMALLGWLDLQGALWSAGAAVIFAGVSRAVWLYAVAHYTSASS